MVDPTPIMTDEQQNDLHEDVTEKAGSVEQKSFANMWKKRTQQKSSQISDDVDVIDDTNTTPRTVSVHLAQNRIVILCYHKEKRNMSTLYDMKCNKSILG